MKTPRALRFAAVALFIAGASGAALAITPGDPMPLPQRSMPAVLEDTVSLADIGGEVGTLVLFANNRCSYVTSWHDRMVDVAHYAQRHSIGVIMVNPSDPLQHQDESFAAMRHKASEHGYGFPYVRDEDGVLAEAFGARRLPEAFLFDGTGTLVYRGAVDDNAEDPMGVGQHFLRSAITELSRGDTITTPMTKAVGCMVD